MPLRKVPPDDELKALYEGGNSPREIAAKLNLNVNTVAAAIARIPGLMMRSASEAQKLTFEHGRKPLITWKGKKQPPDMVEKRVSKIRGENHWLWKGGAARRPYRGVIKKEQCAKCGSKLNLGIHHKNFDHYDNNPDNLEVLCLSCHLSLHKEEYWKAKREGRTPPKSTGKSHWDKAYAKEWRKNNREHYNQKAREWRANRKGASNGNQS